MAKLTNYTRGPKGVNTAEGVVFINPGQTLDVELSKEELASSKKTGWFSKGGADDVETEPTAPVETGLKAEHHGGGKFNITEGEKVLLTDLSKADADTFNALTDAEKAAFVADKAKA